MALINIQTNLKSLKYTDFGVDAPLVTKSVNNPPNQSGLSMEIGRRTDDLERIGKLLISGPGLNHLGRQAALNVLEKNISSEFDNKSGVGRVLRGLGSTATYLASTLAQVPVNGTGTHFVEGFAGKRGYLPQIQGHVLSRNGELAVIDTSTHYDDKGDLINVSSSIFENGSEDLQATGSSMGPMLARYSGSIHVGTPLAYYSKDTAITSATSASVAEYNFEKFEGDDKEANSLNSGFIQRNADIGSDIINLSQIPTIKLNQSPDDIRLENLIDDNLQNDFFKGDLIKFSFVTITPRKGEEDQPTLRPLYFRAYLDTFSDSYNASWNSFKYIGRAEDFYSYEGFNRDISIGFKIAASGKRELDVLIEKLNLLAGSTAPTYTEGSYMRGNFTSVTVGNYLQNQTGVINSVDISWNTDYQWDIESELPMILDVSLSFTPIHSFAPQFGSGFINKANTLLTGATNQEGNE